MTAIEASAGGRLHLGLLDMADASPRRYGGLGCMLEAPKVRVRAEAARITEILGVEGDPELCDALTGAVDVYLSRLHLGSVKLTFESLIPPHIGLGSKTATIMLALGAAAAVNGSPIDPGISRAASARGGTSGIGIHGFFSGGWLVDAGQRRQPGPLLPSRLSSGSSRSLHVMTIPPPPWRVGLFFPGGQSVHGPAEAEFFRANTPVSVDDCLRSLALTYHGLIPALLESDLPSFGAYLESMQAIGFKAREIRVQPSAESLMEELRSLSPCVGMSSMGPVVFAISDRDDNWAAAATRLGVTMLETKVSAEGWAVQGG